jgi:hypothetical protein
MMADELHELMKIVPDKCVPRGLTFLGPGAVSDRAQWFFSSNPWHTPALIDPESAGLMFLGSMYLFLISEGFPTMELTGDSDEETTTLDLSTDEPIIVPNHRDGLGSILACYARACAAVFAEHYPDAGGAVPGRA